MNDITAFYGKIMYRILKRHYHIYHDCTSIEQNRSISKRLLYVYLIPSTKNVHMRCHVKSFHYILSITFCQICQTIKVHWDEKKE